MNDRELRTGCLAILLIVAAIFMAGALVGYHYRGHNESHRYHD
jgi:hypothetical protein